MATGPRKVWFYRDYQGLTGGHLKHAHYFDHVRNTPGFVPKLTFSSEKRAPQLESERQALWAASAAELAVEWQPAAHDVLFLAGTDWRYLDAAGGGGNCRIRASTSSKVCGTPMSDRRSMAT